MNDAARSRIRSAPPRAGGGASRIAAEDVSRGLLDQALVHATEVFAPAIARRAYAAVLVHNHPSGVMPRAA